MLGNAHENVARVGKNVSPDKSGDTSSGIVIADNKDLTAAPVGSGQQRDRNWFFTVARRAADV